MPASPSFADTIEETWPSAMFRYSHSEHGLCLESATPQAFATDMLVTALNQARHHMGIPVDDQNGGRSIQQPGFYRSLV
jgi:hypothetical protein